METRKKDLTHVKYVVYDEEVFLVPPADATEIALFGPTCLKKGRFWGVSLGWTRTLQSTFFANL